MSNILDFPKANRSAEEHEFMCAIIDLVRLYDGVLTYAQITGCLKLASDHDLCDDE